MKSTIILNLMWASIIDPTTFSYINMFVVYDFNATPMGPPGTKVVTHKNNLDQDPHGHLNAPSSDTLNHHCTTTGVTTSSSQKR